MDGAILILRLVTLPTCCRCNITMHAKCEAKHKELSLCKHSKTNIPDNKTIVDNSGKYIIAHERREWIDEELLDGRKRLSLEYPWDDDLLPLPRVESSRVPTEALTNLLDVLDPF